MQIQIGEEDRKRAVSSIERYFSEHMDERIGNIAAGALLGYFLDEIGPTIYNRAVADVQQRLQTRVMDVDIELHVEEFDYWRKYELARKRR